MTRSTPAELGERVARDHHGALEVGGRGVEIFALELLPVGERDRMNHEVEPSPFFRDGGEQRIEAGGVGDVAGQHQGCAHALGERPDPLAERVALVGQDELGAVLRHRPGDPPGERAIIGDPEDQPLLARHQRHGL